MQRYVLVCVLGDRFFGNECMGGDVCRQKQEGINGFIICGRVQNRLCEG